MQRADAIEKVKKLSEVCVERGSTEAEEQTATRLALRLIERYDLALSDFAPPPPTPLHTIQPAAEAYYTFTIRF